MIGIGSFGKVFAALDLQTQELVALKELGKEQLSTSDFLREVFCLTTLNHQNIVACLGLEHHRNRRYLIMDYCEGGTLRNLLNSGKKLGLLACLDIIMQILAALEFAHQKNVIHRDIKPANIKLTPDNRIKLVDFGLVKLLAEDDSRTVTVVQGRGTALFTPLEQYGTDAGHTDVRSDIYSLGATLYNLLTGRLPQSAKERFLNPSAMRPARVLNPTVTRNVSDAVMWAMQMHPKDRPETIAVLQEALFEGGKIVSNEPQFNTDVVEAIWSNRFVMMVAAFLFIIALLLTIL